MVTPNQIRGEHADARELAALYVNSGVPIYPPCHGHAYHTLTWRMSIEGREMDSQNSPENENLSSSDFPTKLKFAVPVKHPLEHFSAEKLSLCGPPSESLEVTGSYSGMSVIETPEKGAMRIFEPFCTSWPWVPF